MSNGDFVGGTGHVVTSNTPLPKRWNIGLPDIAFIGEPGAGKTTASDFLVEQEGYEKHSLAKPLKETAVSLWGPGVLNDRTRLQALGLALREIDPDVLINAWCQQAHLAEVLKRNSNPSGARRPYVIDDTRFENEIDRLRARGFVVVRIQCPVDERVVRMTASGKFHEGDDLESAIETNSRQWHVDHAIANDCDEVYLYEQIMHVLGKELRRR